VYLRRGEGKGIKIKGAPGARETFHFPKRTRRIGAIPRPFGDLAREEERNEKWNIICFYGFFGGRRKSGSRGGKEMGEGRGKLFNQGKGKCKKKNGQVASWVAGENANYLLPGEKKEKRGLSYLIAGGAEKGKDRASQPPLSDR